MRYGALVWRAGKQARIEVNTKDGAFLSQVPADTDQRININKASPSTLQKLPSVGSTIAKKIVDYRVAHGDFESIEDLGNVPGIGRNKLEKLQEWIMV